MARLHPSPTIHTKCERCPNELADAEYPYAMIHTTTREVICDLCGEDAVEREPFGEELWVTLKLDS